MLINYKERLSFKSEKTLIKGCGTGHHSGEFLLLAKTMKTPFHPLTSQLLNAMEVKPQHRGCFSVFADAPALRIVLSLAWAVPSRRAVPTRTGRGSEGPALVPGAAGPPGARDPAPAAPARGAPRAGKGLRDRGRHQCL